MVANCRHTPHARVFRHVCSAWCRSLMCCIVKTYFLNSLETQFTHKCITNSISLSYFDDMLPGNCLEFVKYLHIGCPPQVGIMDTNGYSTSASYLELETYAQLVRQTQIFKFFFCNVSFPEQHYLTCTVVCFIASTECESYFWNNGVHLESNWVIEIVDTLDSSLCLHQTSDLVRRYAVLASHLVSDMYFPDHEFYVTQCQLSPEVCLLLKLLR